MKGLTSVLDRFSEKLRTRKILPSLLEEVSFIQILKSRLGFIDDIEDERYKSSTLHPTQRICDISIVDAISICVSSSTQPEAFVRNQGTTTKYAYFA
jgi:hypothetical protein